MSHLLPHPTMLSRVLQLVLLATLGLAVACSGGGGSGGGGGVASSGGTGSVGVLVTDGPVDPDQFSSILVTFTKIILISDSGQVCIFSGRETIDLRDFEDVGKLVAVGREVPARRFDKIRLLIEDIELVPADGGPSIHPKLPPKLDLNPQKTIHVKPGHLLLLQIDFDAGNSIQIVEKGNGGFNFRPVVIADIVDVRFPGKLVLLEGIVEELDLDEGTFLLCKTRHAVSRPEGDDRITRSEDEDENDPDDRDDFCVKVTTTDDTSIFDESGDPADLDVLMNGEEASVLGRFVGHEDHDDHDEALVFRAEVIQDGPPGTARAIDGEVLTEVDADGRFQIEVDAGQGFGPGTVLTVQLQEGTGIFSRKGQRLDEGDITPGEPVRVVGVLVISNVEDDFLKASVVVLDVEAMTGERISGEITSVSLGGARLEVETDEGSRCVDVPAEARVFAVTVDGDEAEAKAIDRSDLKPGDQVTVFGVPNGCLEARTVIAFFIEGDS